MNKNQTQGNLEQDPPGTNKSEKLWTNEELLLQSGRKQQTIWKVQSQSSSNRKKLADKTNVGARKNLVSLVNFKTMTIWECRAKFKK